MLIYLLILSIYWYILFIYSRAWWNPRFFANSCNRILEQFSLWFLNRLVWLDVSLLSGFNLHFFYDVCKNTRFSSRSCLYFFIGIIRSREFRIYRYWLVTFSDCICFGENNSENESHFSESTLTLFHALCCSRYWRQLTEFFSKPSNADIFLFKFSSISA